MSNTVRWAAPELAPPPPPPPQEPVRHMPSVEELQAIEEAAHAEGYARGHAEGVAAGQAEVRRIAAQMEGILDAFTRPLARLADYLNARGICGADIGAPVARSIIDEDDFIHHTALVQHRCYRIGDEGCTIVAWQDDADPLHGDR